jgi:nitroimidazol reductase NimA-like FMN-containing flavoprotein (pyridoxamine 5'-phosphate oxidase superfamily)
VRAMTEEEISERLAGPHQGVLSLSREDRGPIAVPMSYVYRDERFWMITSPHSEHGRLMQTRGRATLTIHHDVVEPRRVEQWYVTAEGSVEFIDDDPAPLLREILAKDRGVDRADEWTEQSLPAVMTVAVLVPRRLAGYAGVSRLPR